MPATIRVESGIAAGTSFWIERPVLRIGSDPQCELCVPSGEVAPHAATIEFRAGSYRVYNRGSSTLYVGAAGLSSGGSAVWNPDETLLLPGNVRLVLSVDGDPRPSPRPEARPDDDFDDAQIDAASAAADSEASKKSSSTLVQLAVIGFCIAGMAAFLTLGRGDSETAAAERPTFDGIVESVLANDKDGAGRALLPHLQYAQAAVVRGNETLALERFLKLRDLLVRQIEALPEADRQTPRKMLDYAEFRLSELQ